MKLYKTFQFLFLIGLSFCAAVEVYAFEMPCGLYEVVGKLNPEKRELHVYEKTNSHKIIKLVGEKLLTEFPDKKPGYYRVQIEVDHRIGNGNGLARLLNVVGATKYKPEEMQYTLQKAAACK
jgi:hypothetical protein